MSLVLPRWSSAHFVVARGASEAIASLAFYAMVSLVQLNLYGFDFVLSSRLEAMMAS